MAVYSATPQSSNTASDFVRSQVGTGFRRQSRHDSFRRKVNPREEKPADGYAEAHTAHQAHQRVEGAE